MSPGNPYYLLQVTGELYSGDVIIHVKYLALSVCSILVIGIKIKIPARQRLWLIFGLSRIQLQTKHFLLIIFF